MSKLTNKIQSYTLERGIMFDENYTLPPTTTGTAGGTQNWTLVGSTAPSTVDGPVPGQKAWRFITSTTAGVGGRVQNNGDDKNLVGDNSYSYGVWMKVVSSFPTSTGTSLIMNRVAPLSRGYAIVAYYDDNSNSPYYQKNVLSIIIGDVSFVLTDDDYPEIAADKWMYLAIRRDDANYAFYLNGVEVSSGSNVTVDTTTTMTRIDWGNTGTAYNSQIDFASAYIAGYNDVDATDIADIYSEYSNNSYAVSPMTADANMVNPSVSGSVNFIQTALTADAAGEDIIVSTVSNFDFAGSPAEASGLSLDPQISTEVNFLAGTFNIDPIGLEPTIITTTSNSVNITTSILVSIEITEPSASTTWNININILDSMDAISLLTDTQVSTSIQYNFNATALTATSDLMDATISVTEILTDVPMTASALMRLPAITTTRQVNITDVPMIATGNLEDPGWGAQAQIPLFWTPGTLKSKINTYPIEWGVEFNSRPNNTSTQLPVYGSSVIGNPTTTFSVNGTDSGLYQSTDGPYASGTGSVRFTYPVRFEPATFISGGANGDVRKWTDFEYTMGLWFKVGTYPTGTATEAMPILRITGSTFTASAKDFSINLAGATHATNPLKLNMSLGGTTYDFFGPVIDQTWHYLAIRRLGTAGVNNFEVYLDGQLQLVRTNSDTTSYTRIFFLSAETSSNGAINLQNFHLAKASTLNPYEINQIWLAGTNFPPAPSIPAVHNAQVMTASALMTMPTITTVIGDNVEIVTFFSGNATFPSPSWATQDRTVINVDAFEITSVNLGDNVMVETELDHSIPALEFIANARFPEPVISRQPFKANANMLDPVVQTNPNYFNLVMKHQPVLYVEDGQASPVNYGSWQLGPWTSEYMDVNTPATEELQTIGNQKAWKANANGVTLHEPTLYAKPIQGQTVVENLYATRRLSIELWYKSNHFQPGDSRFTNESGILYHDGITTIGEAFDYAFNERFYRRGFCEGIFDERKTVMIGPLQYVGDANGTFGHPWKDWLKYGDASPNFNEWNHVVVTYEPANNADQVIQKFYLNGSIVANNVMTYGPLNDGKISDTYPLKLNTNINDNESIYEGIQIGAVQTLYGGQAIKLKDGTILDEVAIYPKTLTPSDIIEHWTFIQNRTPYVNFTGVFNDIEAQMGNHQVRIVMNARYDSFPLPGLAFRIPQPVVIAGKSKNLFPDAAETNAEMVMPTVSYGISIPVKEMSSYSESGDAKSSDNTYYQYVKSNINPYRYASFDSANTLMDHGTDTGYSVAPIVIGGQVTYYDNPLNNRSVKTAGLNYASDGVILKESEHDDNWGTGAGSWHSSFWMEQAEDDTSTGLRVLWNLNGANDNQHIVLYHYQNKLHLQVNDQVGQPITITSANNVNLFDSLRHHIVINWHHNNNNNTATVYVDAVSVLTQNISTYQVNTINNSSHVGPNDEANNFARLGVGCLITPFASTSLPVVPTNTKLYVDEIYWDKDQILQTAVTNLYNAIPFKSKFKHLATPLTASALMVNPTLSLSTNYLADPMLAFPDIVDPVVSTIRFITVVAQPLEANAIMGDNKRSDDVLILFYVMLASANYGDAGTPRIIDANTMTANIALQNRKTSKEVTSYPILINGNKTFDSLSVWSNYLITTDVNKIIPMREVV